MPTRSLCQKFFNNILSPLHRYRQNALIDATSAVINGASLTLTSIGRYLRGSTSVKHKIKRVGRLLGTRALMSSAPDNPKNIIGFSEPFHLLGF